MRKWTLNCGIRLNSKKANTAGIIYVIKTQAVHTNKQTRAMLGSKKKKAFL